MTETTTDTDDSSTDDPTIPTDDGDSGLGFDAPDDALASIVTAGDPIRSFLKPLTALVDEAKFRIDGDGVRITAADPANVGMTDLQADGDAFAGFQVADGIDELTIGMPLTGFSSGGDLTSALSYARKRSGNGDPVRIDILGDDDDLPKQVRVEVIRPDQQAKRVSVFYTIDPDSIRQEPDIPDIALKHRATPGVDALKDAIQDLGGFHDHVWFSRDAATFIVGSQPNRNPTLTADDDVVDTVEFPNAAWAIDDQDLGEGSLFSVDYVRDFTKALKAAKADRVTVQFDDEFPAMLDWESTDWGFSGTMMVAPRIQSDGGD